MGNEQSSQMSGLIVDEKAVEVTDFWSHHAATLKANNPNTTVSVFIGEPLVGGSLWLTQTPLEKASKNLMLHRHPCILRYVSSWNKGSKCYLAVENVRPLSHVLQQQSTLQICIGLHSILKSLVFLHETARASHNNVCAAAIYVTKDGGWKLGGFEYLCKFTEITSEYMAKARAHRYDKAVDPNENKHLITAADKQRMDFIDVYAYGVLVTEVFKHDKTKNDEEIPLRAFLELCKRDLHHSDILQRPPLTRVLLDDFFNHDFIAIHSFLVELPLKLDEEKDAFFATLMQRLAHFKQVIVARQLAGLLLSRMVLLNKTAQTHVIPRLLTVKELNEIDSDDEGALFDRATFGEHVVPKLLEIFCVRDAQIRLLLLEYFTHFMTCFTREQLQNSILPELLLGIKDTNDHLVAVTLRALADLIPLLGSSVVIGGKRAKLFNDGLPMAHKASARRLAGPASPLETLALATELILHERPSPDGEEGDTSTLTDEGEHENEAASANDWDDWDINDENAGGTQAQTSQVQVVGLSVGLIDDTTTVNNIANNGVVDIFDLDIKSTKNGIGGCDEFDFFQDMEPVINTSSKFLVKVKDADVAKSKQNGDCDSEAMRKFEWSAQQEQEEGWGDDLEAWD